MNKQAIQKICNEILNTQVMPIADLLTHDCGCQKVAWTVNQLLAQTNAKSKKYVGGCNSSLKRSAPKIGRWTFSVKCKENWSKGPYDVKIKLIPTDKKYKDLSRRPVEVSCTCNAWRYNGSDYNAVAKDYSERVLSDGSSPDIRDPKRKYLICKHVASCIPKFRKFIVLKKKKVKK